MTRVRAVSAVQGFRALHCKWLGSRLPGVSVLGSQGFEFRAPN